MQLVFVFLNLNLIIILRDLRPILILLGICALFWKSVNARLHKFLATGIKVCYNKNRNDDIYNVYSIIYGEIVLWMF